MTVKRVSTAAPSAGLSSKPKREVLLAMVAVATLALGALSTVGGLWTAFKPSPAPAKAGIAAVPACGSAINTITIGGAVTGSTIRVDNGVSC